MVIRSPVELKLVVQSDCEIMVCCCLIVKWDLVYWIQCLICQTSRLPDMNLNWIKHVFTFFTCARQLLMELIQQLKLHNPIYNRVSLTPLQHQFTWTSLCTPPSLPSLCPLSTSSPVWRPLFSPKWSDSVSRVAWLLQRFPQLWVGDWIRTWTLHQNHFWQVGGITLLFCILQSLSELWMDKTVQIHQGPPSVTSDKQNDLQDLMFMGPHWELMIS